MVGNRGSVTAALIELMEPSIWLCEQPPPPQELLLGCN